MHAIDIAEPITLPTVINQEAPMIIILIEFPMSNVKIALSMKP